MFSVIFEVHRKAEKVEEYLDLAMGLKSTLQTIDGFIDNERFESQLRPGWLLSHSTWRDEKSVIRWRVTQKHHHVQERGRFEIFSDYRLRVGEITADTEPPKGIQVSEQRFDESEIGESACVTLTELFFGDEAKCDRHVATLAQELQLPSGKEAGLLASDVFKSISTIYPDNRPHRPGKLALLATWSDAAAGAKWEPRPLEGSTVRHRRVRVIRDYGMFDRREAPQYYDDVDSRRPTLHAAPRTSSD